MNILDLVSNALQNLNIPVVYGWFDAELQTHITFLEFDNLEDEFADDAPTTEEHYIQVDIWTKDTIESQTFKKQVKDLMKNNNFIYQDGQDQFEFDKQLWHIATRWLLIENI